MIYHRTHFALVKPFYFFLKKMCVGLSLENASMAVNTGEIKRLSRMDLSGKISMSMQRFAWFIYQVVC